MPAITETAKAAKRQRDREAAARRRADPELHAADLASRRAATERAKQAGWEANVAQRSALPTTPAAARRIVAGASSPLTLLQEAALLREQAWQPSTLRHYIGSERWIEKDIPLPTPQDQLRLYIAFRILVVGSLALALKLDETVNRPRPAIVVLMGISEPTPAAALEDQSAARDLRDQLVACLNADSERLRGQLQSPWTAYQLDKGRWVELELERPEPIDIQALTGSLRVGMVIGERVRVYNSVGPTASKLAITTLVDQLKAEQERSPWVAPKQRTE